MKRLLTFVILSVAAVLMAAPSSKNEVCSIAVAVNGEANSFIAIDDNAHRVIWQAARELQNYFRKITSARIQIHNSVSADTPVFVLGTPESEVVKPVLKDKIPAMVKQIKDDGYAVIVRGQKVYIIGTVPRGVLNGVHRFILNHTDFIWVRPYKELANFTFDPNLKLTVKSHVDNPAFRVRGWLANARIAQLSEEFFFYCVRNGINRLPGGNEPAFYGRYADNGMSFEFGGGHDMSSRWLPKQIFGKTNPEFYMEIAGKRVTSGRVQLCYANENMHKAFIANTLKILKGVPDFYSCINIMIDDTQNFCECKLCMAPIKLPNGKVLERSNEAFKSTLFFLFLNKVAAAVEKARPGMKIKCFGYLFTAIPPEISVAPNIRISFCPYVRNDKETLHGLSNAKWLERTVRFAEKSPSVIWREYYFSGAGFPRAYANIIAQDLRFIAEKGVKEVTSENSWGDRPGMRKKNPLKETDFFNITGAEFWTITHLFWNPYQDPDALRNEYIKRVYREGAPGVQKFYKLLRDSWLNDPTASAFNDDFRRSMGRYVISKKLTEPCRAALAEAAKTVKNPVSARQLVQLTGTFEKWLELAAAASVPEYNVPKVEVKDFPGFDFDSGVWAKAKPLTPMCRMGTREPAAEETLVKVIHDGRNMYVAVQCRFPDGKTTAKPDLPTSAWPGGDHVELFLGRRDGGYNMMVYNTYANSTSSRYDAYCTDGKWDGEWDVKSQFKNGEWRSVAIIPFKTVGFVIEQSNRMSALVYRVRTRRSVSDRSHHFSWGGGKVHSADAFGDFIFALE